MGYQCSKRVKPLCFFLALLILVGLPFGAAALPEPEEEPVWAFPFGDVNGDRVIDAVDSQLVLQSLVGLHQLEPVRRFTADVNADGEVNVLDAMIILQKTVGLVGQLPTQVWEPLFQEDGALQYTLPELKEIITHYAQTSEQEFGQITADPVSNTLLFSDLGSQIQLEEGTVTVTIKKMGDLDGVMYNITEMMAFLKRPDFAYNSYAYNEVYAQLLMDACWYLGFHAKCTSVNIFDQATPAVYVPNKPPHTFEFSARREVNDWAMSIELKPEYVIFKF